MRRRIKLFSIITLGILIVSMVTLIFFLPVKAPLADVSFSRVVYDDHQRLLRVTLSQDAKYRVYTPLKDIAPSLLTATLLEEDQYFYWHLGVNPVATIKAAWQTYVLRTRKMGASTISMQLARMQYKIHSKTFLGKVQQIWRALQLEAHYSKNDILAAYLNLAPYGNNVEGIGAASLLYFNKPAAQLTLPEVLTLVVIPQNPTKRFPDKQTLTTTRAKFFARWVREYPQDKKVAALLDLPITMRSVRLAPFAAPHFVNAILKHAPFAQDQLSTTLSLTLQNSVEQTTRHYLERKQALGANNAAVLLVDTRDMGVKVMVGSADFFKSNIAGQINGTEIKRSPGSTLKPFIYALALDQGVIHPGTVLKDVPRSFGSYNPENFDYDFVGPIKAADALILSRNIPAVYLADQLKRPNLYEFLQKAHVAELKSEKYYGLALVLGGAELSMQELVSLYAMLANGGVWQPLRLYKTDAPATKEVLLSPEASFLVLDMLKDSPPPGADFGVSHDAMDPVAFKTGTSSGYRDAWTVGVFGPYVLAVWVGNFNNQGNPAFVGKEMAAPLFFEIVHSLKSQVSLATPKRMHAPLNLRKVAVCKASGMLPTKYCTDTEETWFIPGKSPINTDTIYREVAINKVTGLRACEFDNNTQFAIYEFWPSDLLKIFKRAGIERRVPPAYDASCALLIKNAEGFVPQIVSPQATVNYIARIQAVKETTIPFTAVADADVTHLYWFVNETYVGKTARDEAYLWHARPGKYTVRVVDDYGRADARKLMVSVE